jgi:hypothetical protein
MGIGNKWEIGGFFFFFVFPLFLCVQEFPKVDAALWYGGTMTQKIRGEKIFQEQRKDRSNGKIRKELNDLAQYWAILSAVFGV